MSNRTAPCGSVVCIFFSSVYYLKHLILDRLNHLSRNNRNNGYHDPCVQML